jgi:hypothetical protein
MISIKCIFSAKLPLMNIPSLPTDNISKFLAFLSLALIALWVYDRQMYNKNWTAWQLEKVEHSRKTVRHTHLLYHVKYLQEHLGNLKYGIPAIDTTTPTGEQITSTLSKIVFVDTSIAYAERLLEKYTDELKEAEIEAAADDISEETVSQLKEPSHQSDSLYWMAFVIFSCSLFFWHRSQTEIDNSVRLQNERLRLEIEKMRRELDK